MRKRQKEKLRKKKRGSQERKKKNKGKKVEKKERNKQKMKKQRTSYLQSKSVRSPKLLPGSRGQTPIPARGLTYAFIFSSQSARYKVRARNGTVMARIKHEGSWVEPRRRHE